MYPVPISNPTPGPPNRWACCKHQNLQHAQSHKARRHDEPHLPSTHLPVPAERSWEGPVISDAVIASPSHPERGAACAAPRFVELAAAPAVVAAPAEQEEDDEDDPPRVVATAHKTIVAIAVHKEYLQEVFSAALPLIPWYSGGPIVCVVQANNDSTLSNR